MASLCPSFAIPMNLDEVPETLGTSVEEADEALDDEELMSRSLQGASRKGWFGYTMELIGKKYGVTSLDFLSCKPWDSATGYFTTVLDNRHFDSIIEAITSLLHRFEAQPGELLEIETISLGGWEEEDIVEMFQESKPSLYPESDDGDDPYYLFEYLKSFLELCQNAKRDNKVIFFVQVDA
jgi:hypothetical protein